MCLATCECRPSVQISQFISMIKMRQRSLGGDIHLNVQLVAIQNRLSQFDYYFPLYSSLFIRLS